METLPDDDEEVPNSVKLLKESVNHEYMQLHHDLYIENHPHSIYI